MPPLKTSASNKSNTLDTENSGIKITGLRSTRAITSHTQKKENIKDVGPNPKRKAISPLKGSMLKRSVLGNITNNRFSRSAAGYQGELEGGTHHVSERIQLPSDHVTALAIETKCVINSGKKTSKKVATSTVTKPTVASKAKATILSTNQNKPSATATVTKTVCTVKQNEGISMLPPLPKSRLTLSLKPPTQSHHPRQSIQVGSLKVVPQTTSGLPKPVEKPVVTRPVTRQSPAANKKVVPASKCKITAKPKGTTSNPIHNTRRSSGRRSTLDSTDSSLYVSALSDILDEDNSSPTISKEPEKLPSPKINIDKEYVNDPYQCADYAFHIFEYLKTREAHYKIPDYMSLQGPNISQNVRAILVDWMVEIQESFELNHETLYLAVKVVDTYLSKIKVSRNSLQLVGATAMLIAAKYDERIPPAIGDFIYICDGTYKKKDMLKMEINILKVIDFELGFPLSYRFLRRYARCAQIQMPLLTLARFVLELALMDYSIVTLSDSKLAAAALYLALKMDKKMTWDDTLIYFSGYRVQDFIHICHILNNNLHQRPRTSLTTVRNKYSHTVFYEVAKIPLVRNEDL